MNLAIKKQRVLPITDVMNFRDLGGYTNDQGQQVKWHTLYRSAQLDRIQSDNIHQIDALGIKTVVDLRFGEEMEKYPTVASAFGNAEIISWHELQQAPAEQAMIPANCKLDGPTPSWRDGIASNDPEAVRTIMRENYPRRLYTHAAIYQQMLLKIISQQTPLLFHCAAGKDRTGIAAAMILSLLGVSEQQIVDDYLLTQQELSQKMESWIAGGAANSNARYNDLQNLLDSNPKHVIQPVFDADPSYITRLLAYVDSEYGNFTNYAEQQLLFGADHVAQLKQRLLEPIG